MQRLPLYQQTERLPYCRWEFDFSRQPESDMLEARVHKNWIAHFWNMTRRDIGDTFYVQPLQVAITVRGQGFSPPEYCHDDAYDQDS
jgi:hypothetical protein